MTWFKRCSNLLRMTGITNRRTLDLRDTKKRMIKNYSKFIFIY